MRHTLAYLGIAALALVGCASTQPEPPADPTLSYCKYLEYEECTQYLTHMVLTVHAHYKEVGRPSSDESAAYKRINELSKKWADQCRGESFTDFGVAACRDLLEQFAANVPVLAPEFVPDEI